MSNLGQQMVEYYKRLGMSAKTLNDDDAPGITTGVAHGDKKLAERLYGPAPNKPKVSSDKKPEAKPEKPKAKRRGKGEHPTRRLRKGSSAAKDRMAELRKLIGRPKGNEEMEDSEQ